MSFNKFYDSLKTTISAEKMLIYSRRKTSNISVTDEKIMERGEHIEKVEQLPEGGCHMYIQGHPYPMRIFFPNEKITALSMMKRIVPYYFRFIVGQNGFRKKNIFEQVFIMLAMLEYKELFINFIDWCLSDVYETLDKYNQPTRELYRVLTGRVSDKVRNIICAIIEYDSAYRFRFQDVIMNLDKSNNTIREIERLMMLMHGREDNHDGGAGKILIYKKYILWYLRLNRKLLRTIKEIINDINLEEVSPSIEDRYWMLAPNNYRFLGLSLEEMKHEKEIMAKDKLENS